MPKQPVHDKYLNEYLLYMMAHDILTPPEKQSLQHVMEQADLDISAVLAILLTRYLNGQHRVPKSGNLHIAWEYVKNPADHHCFINLLHVTPLIFDTILTLIEDHPSFMNNSNNAQTPVEVQLAVTLYRMGRYCKGNPFRFRLPPVFRFRFRSRHLGSLPQRLRSNDILRHPLPIA